MRELALLALNAAALIPGAALLKLFGVPIRGGWAFGLAYLTGVASVSLIQTVLLPFGLPVRPIIPAAIAGGLCLAAFIWRRRGGSRDERPAQDSEPVRFARQATAIALLALGVLGATIVIGVLTARVTPLSGFDAWSQWTPKAELLAHRSLFAGTLWGSHVYSYVNPAYPLALPVFEADQLRTIGIGYGSADLSLLDIGPWLLLAGYVASLVYLNRRRVGLLILTPLVLCFAAAPGIQLQTRDVLADVPLAVFISLGALLLAEWLESKQPPALMLGTLFLAVGANTKEEGTAAAFLVSVAAICVVAARRDRRAAGHLLAVLAVLVVAVVPWRVWLAAHDIHGVVSLGQALDPGYMAAHASRVPRALDSVLSALASPGDYLLLPAAAIAVIVVSIGRRGVGAWRPWFFLASISGYVAIVVWTEWASRLPLSAYVSEGNRFMTTAAALALVAIVDLAPGLRAGRHVESQVGLHTT